MPLELGCSGRTAHRRFQRWYARGIWERLHLHFLTILRKAGVLEAELAVIDNVLARAFGGGNATGPSPVDRRKLGSKHTLLVDSNGVPLVIHTAPVNARDYKLILPVVEDFPEIGGKPGRPRKHPDMIYADLGYDSEMIRQRLRSQGIKPVIARRGTDHGSSLGRSPMGGRTHHQLVQGAAAASDSLRLLQRRARRMEQAHRFSPLLPCRNPLGHLSRIGFVGA